MSNSSYAADLIVAAQVFSVYSTFASFGFGLIGNVVDVLVLTQLKIFAHNRCAFYLIAESLVDIVQLSQNVGNEVWKRLLNGLEPTSISSGWCKLRTILPQWHRLMLSCIVCFASIDQFLSTHPRPYLRQLTSLRVARYQIWCAACLCLLHTIPSGLYLQIQSSLGCVISNEGLIIYFSYAFYPVINGLLPISVSSLFSLLAYRNVRRIVRRQIPLDRRRLDQQFTAMIFIRVIFFVVLQLPFAVYRIFSLNFIVARSNTMSYAIDRWAQATVFALVYWSHAVSVDFLSGTTHETRV